MIDHAGGGAILPARVRRWFGFFLGAIVIMPSLASNGEGFASRESVDVLWSGSASAPVLLALVPGPRAEAPGLYRAAAPRPSTAGANASIPVVRVCALSGAAQFSFDRRRLLALSVEGDRRLLTLHDLPSCRRRAQLVVPARTFDFDARGNLVAIAERHVAGMSRIHLYLLRREAARRIATAISDGNVELGFDGRAALLHNFDRMTAGPAAWRIPALTPVGSRPFSEHETPLPASGWRIHSDHDKTEVRHADGRRHRLPSAWKTGTHLWSVSGDGSRLLGWRIEDAEGRLLLAGIEPPSLAVLARGHIDAAAISADGRYAAWSERDGDRVRLRHRVLPP